MIISPEDRDMDKNEFHYQIVQNLAGENWDLNVGN